MSEPAPGFEFVKWVARTLGGLNKGGQAIALTFLEDLAAHAGLWNCAATARRLKIAKVLSVERTYRADAKQRMGEAARMWAEQAKLTAEAGRIDAEAEYIRAQARTMQSSDREGGVSALEKKNVVEVLPPDDPERAQREATKRVQEAINAIRAMGGEVIIEVRLPGSEPAD
jgi:myo-inositol catabolism protein IolC